MSMVAACRWQHRLDYRAFPDGIYNLLLQEDDIKRDSEESDFYENDIESDKDDP